MTRLPKNTKTRLYRPANGTEGEMFKERWCYRCARYGDEEKGEELCSIEIATLIVDVDHPAYPKEWVTTGPYVSDARCTAFTTEIKHKICPACHGYGVGCDTCNAKGFVEVS
jgi:hypothetical protein